MNEIKYLITDRVRGPGEYIEQFDDIVKITLLPNNPTVGRYLVRFTTGEKCRMWIVGHPDSYVKYGGVMYKGEEVEKLRNLMEQREIRVLLENM